MKTMNAQTLKGLFVNGHQSLVNGVDKINELNVFPVPDGDTGTNMKMTMDGGVNAVYKSKVKKIGVLARELARGMVFSARGNSGVILSQFFKGLSLGLENKDTATPEDFALAMLCGVEQAYKVVNNPTEGTILTVMREASQAAYEAHVDTFEEYFKVYLTEANQSLARTPELLPVLKKAGVVDSGGAGFILIIEGMALAVDGKMLETIDRVDNHLNAVDPSGFNADSELEFGYCTEFILQLQNSKVDIPNFKLSTITDYLETVGNSIVAFIDEDIVKVHVHTFTPGEVINYCQKFGEYVTFKMENMSVQHSEITLEQEDEEVEFKETTVVAVSSGDGISEIFKGLGVDYIVSGGQTMNPSTDDFLAAFDKLNTNNIIVFPNNSNIIMAAKQAAENYQKANVIVIETKTIAQCYSALSLLGEEDLDTLVSSIKMAISGVTSLEITYAVRDSQIDQFTIKKDDYLGFVNHHLAAVSKTKFDSIKDLFNTLEDMEEKEVVTIFYGEDVTEEEIESIVSYLEETYDWLEVGAVCGGQKVYSYIIAIQ